MKFKLVCPTQQHTYFHFLAFLYFSFKHTWNKLKSCFKDECLTAIHSQILQTPQCPKQDLEWEGFLFYSILFCLIHSNQRGRVRWLSGRRHRIRSFKANNMDSIRRRHNWKISNPPCLKKRVCACACVHAIFLPTVYPISHIVHFTLIKEIIHRSKIHQKCYQVRLKFVSFTQSPIFKTAKCILIIQKV